MDVLTALNAGSKAVEDLQIALADVMGSFRLGQNSFASVFLGRRIEKVLFAATKSDQLHHTNHDRLEAILRLLVNDAATRAEFSGAAYDVSAISAIRSTREAAVKVRGEELQCIAGIPQIGETVGTTLFDGKTEAAIFPGDLQLDPQAALDGSAEGKLKFVRFRPPPLQPDGTFPNIRLDRALEFLIGDRFP